MNEITLFAKDKMNEFFFGLQIPNFAMDLNVFILDWMVFIGLDSK